jgi:hypothetical protein
MSNPTIRIHNTATDEVIDREMTAAELAQAKKDDQNAAILESKILEKATARQAILDRLGLSTEDAALLFS